LLVSSPLSAVPEVLAGDVSWPGEKSISSGTVDGRLRLLELRTSGTVDLDGVVTFLQGDIEDEPVRAQVLPQLALDVALQVLVALVFRRKIIANIVSWGTIKLLRGLGRTCAAFLFFLKKLAPQLLDQAPVVLTPDIRELW